MNFKKYIKAVGTGPKGNRDLEEVEIIDAIKNILDRKASDAQIGAFLVAWRTKLESNNELKGAIKALNSYIKFNKIEDSIKLGYSFDGRVKNPFLFPLYENILKEFYKKNTDIKRLNLVISYDFLQPAKIGLTTKDLIESLNLQGEYVYFVNREEYLKELSDLTSLRHELGLRTAFNTIEKLLNPSLSSYAVTTAFHKPYVAKYLDIYADYYDDISVVKASEGSPEVFKDGKFWFKKDNEIKEESFSLADFEVSYDKAYENISLNEAIDIIKNPSEELIKLAKFNIALYLVFAKRVTSLEEAWKRLK